MATDRDKVRLLCMDRASPWVFTDVEVDTFLEIHSQDVFLAASSALRSMANSATLRAVAIRAGAWSEDTTQAAKNMLALADKLEQQAYETPADELVEMDWEQFAFDRREANAAARES